MDSVFFLLLHFIPVCIHTAQGVFCDNILKGYLISANKSRPLQIFAKQRSHLSRRIAVEKTLHRIIAWVYRLRPDTPRQISPLNYNFSHDAPSSFFFYLLPIFLRGSFFLCFISFGNKILNYDKYDNERKRKNRFF